MMLLDQGDHRTSSTLLAQQVSCPFVPLPCTSANSIGVLCNTSDAPCDILQPCENEGICNNTNTTSNLYLCSCRTGFHGDRCEGDRRPCKRDTCLNHGEHLRTALLEKYKSIALWIGICNETANNTQRCTCSSDWQGTHCETSVNYCGNVTCLNNGVCRSRSQNYTCDCLGSRYSGRHCEVKSSQLKAHQVVSRSFAFVAICAMTTAAMFYCSDGYTEVRFWYRRGPQRSKAATEEASERAYCHSIYLRASTDQLILDVT